MNSKRDYKKGLILAFINSLSTGTVGFIDKIGSTQVHNPLLFSVQSVCVSFFFVLIFALFYFNKSFIKTIKELKLSSWFFTFIVGVFASGIFIILRFLGLAQSTGTFATLTITVTAALTALAAYLFLKERLNNSFWILFMLILISMYMVSTGRLGLITMKTGDLFLLAGAIFLTIANISAKMAVKTTPPVILTLGRFFFGGVFLLLMVPFLLKEANNLYSFSIWVILSGLLWSISATLYNFAVKYLGVTLATTFLMLAPIYTLILESALLHYVFNPYQIVGTLIVVISGILIFIPRNRPTT